LAFQNDPDIVICMVDKNGGIVPVTIKFYNDECDLHLLNKINYHQFLSKPDLRILFTQLRAILAKHDHLEHPGGKLKHNAKYILQDEKLKEIRFCRFYPVIKMHKNPITTRPIVPNIDFPTYYVSKFLHHHLWPIVKKLPSYIEDAKDLMKQLDERSFAPGTTLLASDIVSMYPNIPITTETMRKIRQMILKYGESANFDFSLLALIEDLIWFTLTNTFIENRDRYFQQTTGVSMGTPGAVAISCLAVAAVEEEVIEVITEEIHIKRFVDDIFGIAPEERTLQLFVELYNEKIKNPTINIEATIGKSVNYMDLTMSIANEGGTIQFNTYQKPTRINQFLLYTSDHATCIFKSIVTSAIDRIRVNNSKDDDFNARLATLKQELLQRQYPQSYLDKIFSEHKPTRKSLLQQQEIDPTALAIFPTTLAAYRGPPKKKKRQNTLCPDLIFLTEFNAYTQILPIRDIICA